MIGVMAALLLPVFSLAQDSVPKAGVRPDQGASEIFGGIFGGQQKPPTESSAFSDQVPKAGSFANQSAGTLTEPATNFIGNIWQGFLAVLGKALGFIIFKITYFVGYLAGILFTLGGLFLTFGLRLNGSLLLSPTVNVGWVITRDLANLGFVLAIVFIAIATILRVNQYGIKKILWRLVVAALLVNFSLTIAGIFLDMSGLLTNFFVARVVPPPSSTAASFSGVFQNENGIAFSSALANAFGLQELLHSNESGFNAKQYQGITEFGAAMLALLANMFFVTLFTITGAVTMLTIAALVFVRYVAMTILLILMPIAWIGWVFPGSKFSEAYKMWWGKFIEWLIWLPVATFFIYLTVLIVTNQAANPNSILSVAQSITTNPQGTALDNFLVFFSHGFETIGRMLAILGLLAGGLIATRRISDTGAKVVLGTADAAHNYLTGKVRGAAYGATALPAGYLARRALQSYLRGGREVDAQGKEITPARGQRWVNRISKYGKYVGVSGAASALAGYIAKGKDEVAEYQKNYLDKLNDDALKSYTEMIGDPIAMAAKATELAKRNKLEDIAPEGSAKLKNYEDALKKMGVEKDFLNNMPHLAGSFGKTIEEVVRKITDVSKISETALKKAEIQAALSANQYQKLRQSNEVTEKTLLEMKDGLGKNFEAVKLEIQTKLTTLSPQDLAKLGEIEDKLYYRMKLTNTPAWTIRDLKTRLVEEMVAGGMPQKQAAKEITERIEAGFGK